MNLSQTTLSTAIILSSLLFLGACSSDDKPATTQPEFDDVPANPGEGSSVAAPVDGPVAAPVDGPVAAPVDGPVAAPVDGPVATPVDGPVATPVDGPVTAPVDGPVAGPVDAPVDAPPLAPTGPTEPGTTELPGSSDTSAIAGLWDLTVEEFFDGVSDGIDVAYIEITADGRTTLYDYQQDSFDMGDNCYEIEPGIIRSLGDNLYLVDPDAEFDDEEQQVSIIRNGNSLNVSFVDTFDDNENGNFTEILNFSYPLLTGVDPVFNECDNLPPVVSLGVLILGTQRSKASTSLR